MFPWMMHPMLGCVVAMTLLAQAGSAPSDAGSHEREGGKTEQLQIVLPRTGKERLGGKHLDEQRVNNCKVPPELRGPKPRPDCDKTAPDSKR